MNRRKFLSCALVPIIPTRATALLTGAGLTVRDLITVGRPTVADTIRLMLIQSKMAECPASRIVLISNWISNSKMTLTNFSSLQQKITAMLSVINERV